MIRSVLLLLSITLMSVSCNKENLPEDLTQPVLFQYEYVNHAWGYNHFGWMIDNEGKVRGFNLPKTWNRTDDMNYISKEDLIENLNQTDTLYSSVENSKLLNHFENRFDMMGAKMDTSDVFMADAGVGGLYAYVWDTSVEKYKMILLATRGDISVTNTNSKAKSAVKWLKSVGEETDRFSWFDF